MRPRTPSAIRGRPWTLVPLAQGTYLLLTGLWPLVWMDGFLAVIGPKAELWLVRTVGLLAVVIGATLAAAGLQSRVAPEIAGLGAGTAAVFLAVDLVGWAAGAIGPVYLADALVEAGILAAWASWLARRG